MAYSINLGVTLGLGKESQWAWRIPIIIMQLFPILLMSVISRLPESPRYFMSKEQKAKAKKSLETLWSKEDAKSNSTSCKKHKTTKAAKRSNTKTCSSQAVPNSILQ